MAGSWVARGAGGRGGRAGGNLDRGRPGRPARLGAARPGPGGPDRRPDPAALAAWLVWALLDQAALAQTAAEIQLLELDQEHGLGRYQVTLRAGSTLWDVANTFLPLDGLDRGDAAAYDRVIDSFQRAFPGRT